MNEHRLKIANKIQGEIEVIESFLWSAERVWTGKLIKRTSKYIFKSSPFGWLDESELFLKTELKNKLLDVLREELAELKDQLQKV